MLFQQNTAYLVNSEGSQIQTSWTNAQLSVSVGVKADDGMNLSRLEQRFGRTPADLPPDSEVDKIATVIGDLNALHDAPLAIPTSVGDPRGHAAGVFFHEVFGHRIEGHRQKDLTSGQTRVVRRQGIAGLAVGVRRSEIVTLNGVQLGFYRYDEAGSPRSAWSTTASWSAS